MSVDKLAKKAVAERQVTLYSIYLVLAFTIYGSVSPFWPIFLSSTGWTQVGFCAESAAAVARKLTSAATDARWRHGAGATTRHIRGCTTGRHFGGQMVRLARWPRMEGSWLRV